MTAADVLVVLRAMKDNRKRGDTEVVNAMREALYRSVLRYVADGGADGLGEGSQLAAMALKAEDI